MVLGIYGIRNAGSEVKILAGLVNKKQNRWSEIIYIDDFVKEHKGEKAYSLEEVIEKYGKNGIEVVIVIGEPAVREKIYNRLQSVGVNLTNVVHPDVYIDPSITLGNGVIIYPGVFFGSGNTIGDNTIIGPQAVLGHDARIGKHCYIGTNCNVSGGASIGERTFMGYLSSIRDHTNVGNDVILAPGATVFRDLPDEVIAVGNPARISKKNEERVVFKNRDRWEKSKTDND